MCGYYQIVVDKGELCVQFDVVKCVDRQVIELENHGGNDGLFALLVAVELDNVDLLLVAVLLIEDWFFLALDE